MKAKVKHLYEIIAGAILSLLGFGCTTDPYRDALPEYGQPHADYRLVGSVSSEETGAPIPGIKATFKRYTYTDANGDKQYVSQEFTTDQEGKIDSPMNMYPVRDGDEYLIVLEDMDGEENGGIFGPEVIASDNISIQQSKKGDGRWYDGAFTLTFNAKMYRELPMEYGMPHANYRISGKVTDQDGNPIPGIEVLAKLWGDNQDFPEEEVSAQTNSEGKYVLNGEAWPGVKSASVEFTDTDGELNGGLFESADAEASFTKTGEGDGRWYEGEFSGELDITLKKASE